MTVEQVVWISPFGAQTPLKIGLNAQAGDMMGRFMPPVLHVDDLVPLAPGGRHRFVTNSNREFTLPFNVLDTTLTGLRTQIRNIVSAMNPLNGAGIIRITSPLGDVREIECFYTAGMEGDENIDKNGRYGQQFYASFRAYDPYWRDTGDTTNSWVAAAPPLFFPIFPLRLASSSIAVQTTIVNAGDVPTWPVWTVTGPGGGAAGIELQNLTLGKSLLFETTLLGIGESISIDTRPGFKTVTKNDGTNLFGDLDPTSSLWPLINGDNAVNLVLNNAVAGQTILALNYRGKYLTP